MQCSKLLLASEYPRGSLRMLQLPDENDYGGRPNLSPPIGAVKMRPTSNVGAATQKLRRMSEIEGRSGRREISAAIRKLTAF